MQKLDFKDIFYTSILTIGKVHYERISAPGDLKFNMK